MSKKVYLIVSLLLISGLAAGWYFFAPSQPSSEANNNEAPDLGA